MSPGGLGGFTTIGSAKKDECTQPPPRAIEIGTVRFFLGSLDVTTSRMNGYIFEDEVDDDDPASEDSDDEPFSATLSGSTLNGGWRSFSFTAERVSASPRPAVRNFGADLTSIQAGQPVTLRWNVFNASSVTIDQGIGVQPASGSVVVFPAGTTTYRLTATGPGDTTTTETTSTEVQAPPSAGRQRAVRH